MFVGEQEYCCIWKVAEEYKKPMRAIVVGSGDAK
jgi:hypothetical protein